MDRRNAYFVRSLFVVDRLSASLEYPSDTMLSYLQSLLFVSFLCSCHQMGIFVNYNGTSPDILRYLEASGNDVDISRYLPSNVSACACLAAKK